MTDSRFSVSGVTGEFRSLKHQSTLARSTHAAGRDDKVSG